MPKRLKMTKYGLAAGLILASIVIIQGCNGFRIGNSFLNKPPNTGVDEDSVFSNPVTAKQVLWHAYQTMPITTLKVNYRYDTQVMCNDPLAAITDIDQSFLSNGGAITFYYTGSLSSSTPPPCTKYDYNSPAWTGIRYAYLFINNIHKTPGISKQTKERLKAEARMIIAAHYIEFFRNFGGMIWVNHAYGPNDNFNLKRLTAMATLDSIVTMIDSAAPHLPFTLNDPSTQAGRFTQAGAMGLKCRVLLFGASPLFNSDQPYMPGEASDQKLVWMGGYHKSLWQRAATACGDFITKDKQEGMPYHLVNTGNPRKDFRKAYYSRQSSELLISTRTNFKTPGMPPLYTSGNNKGAVDPTDNYVKMFPMANGDSIHAAGSDYDPTHPYKDRDPRLYETVLVNGDTYKNRTAQLWIGGIERPSKGFKGTESGYRLRKFILDPTKSVNNVVQFPYLRLPEVYLSYAEALDEVNGKPTANACKYVNMIRNRVDLGNLPGCMAMSQKEFRKAVVKERALELGFERVRWFDIARWKMKKAFTKTLYGMDICKKGVSPAGVCKDQGDGYHQSNEFIYSRFKLPVRFWKNNFSPKWYLSPFPLGAINKNKELVQNPGWTQ